MIPLIGKVPAIKSWKEFQTRLPEPDEVSFWFRGGRPTPTGLGIVTGKLSRLVVVDCDSQADAAFWLKKFPVSPFVVETGGGGIHLYYAMPDGDEVRNRANVFRRKIDLRGEGGYATAPPSIHPNGKEYAWQMHAGCSVLPTFDPAWHFDKPQTEHIAGYTFVGNVRNVVSYINCIHAHAGHAGHNATFRVACKLRDASVSPQ